MDEPDMLSISGDNIATIPLYIGSGCFDIHRVSLGSCSLLLSALFCLDLSYFLQLFCLYEPARGQAEKVRADRAKHAAAD